MRTSEEVQAILTVSERSCSRCGDAVLNIVTATIGEAPLCRVFRLDPGTAQVLAAALDRERVTSPMLAKIECLETQHGVIVTAACPFCGQALPCTHLSLGLETLPVEDVTLHWSRPVAEPPEPPALPPSVSHRAHQLSLEEVLV